MEEDTGFPYFDLEDCIQAFGELFALEKWQEALAWARLAAARWETEIDFAEMLGMEDEREAYYRGTVWNHYPEDQDPNTDV